MTTCAELTNDQLADRIVTWAGRIAAAEAVQLRLIAEFDRREAWAGPGLLSCAHWLTWRTGLGPVAARERVRVARALAHLPALTGAFEGGLVSWSQVRAVTRVATPDDEQSYVELARHTTAAQLERVVRGVRRVRRTEEDDADPELAAHRMRSRVAYDDDGNLTLTLRVPAEVGAVVLAAVEQLRAELDRQRVGGTGGVAGADGTDGAGDTVAACADAAAAGGPASAEAPASLPDASAVSPGTPQAAADTPDASAGTRSADPERSAEPPAPRSATTLTEAFVEMAGLALEQLAATRPGLARRHRARLVVHVDPLSGWARLRDGELLPPAAVASLPTERPWSTALTAVRPLTAADLRAEDLGRTRRLASLPLRELLGTVDGECCRFPGCDRRRGLDAHHVRRWSDGGSTDLANLVLLCGRHHTLVHRWAFELRLGADRSLHVRTADGVAVAQRPSLPWADAAELDPGHLVQSSTLPPVLVDRMDLRYVVSVLTQQAA